MSTTITLSDGRVFPCYNGEALSWNPGGQFTIADGEQGYPRTRAVLRALREHRPEQFAREKADALRGCFGLFRGNGERFYRIVEEESR